MTTVPCAYLAGCDDRRIEQPGQFLPDIDECCTVGRHSPYTLIVHRVTMRARFAANPLHVVRSSAYGDAFTVGVAVGSRLHQEQWLRLAVDPCKRPSAIDEDDAICQILQLYHHCAFIVHHKTHPHILVAKRLSTLGCHETENTDLTRRGRQSPNQ